MTQRRTIINADGEKFQKSRLIQKRNNMYKYQKPHFNDSITTSDASDAKTDIDEISDMDWSYDGEYIVYCNDRVYMYTTTMKKIKTLKYQKTTYVNYKATYRCVIPYIITFQK